MNEKTAIEEVIGKLFEIIEQENWALLDSVHDKLEKTDVIETMLEEVDDSIPVAQTFNIHGFSKNHEVKKYVDGSYSCTCLFFNNKVDGAKPCHHIIQAALRQLHEPANVKINPNIKTPVLDFGSRSLFLKKNYLALVERSFDTYVLTSDVADQIIMMIKAGWSLPELDRAYNLAINVSTTFLNRVMSKTTFPIPEITTRKDL